MTQYYSLTAYTSIILVNLSQTFAADLVNWHIMGQYNKRLALYSMVASTEPNCSLFLKELCTVPVCTTYITVCPVCVLHVLYVLYIIGVSCLGVLQQV